MRIGDYVRTNDGNIWKPYKIENIEGKWFFDDYYLYDKDYVKSSPSIIDLIEVGDIVITPLGEIIRPTSSNVDELKDYWKITRNPIKSIVTHEEFESMEYKL